MSEQMKRRFHELSALIDRIKARSGPLRAERDALVQDADRRAKALLGQIRAAEAGLVELENERGRIVRDLRGPDGVARMG